MLYAICTRVRKHPGVRAHATASNPGPTLPGARSEAFCHQTFGDVRCVVLLLAYGTLDGGMMAAMRDECARIREQDEAQATGADSSRAHGGDPAVLAARQQHEQQRRRERWQARQEPWHAGAGYCDACSASGVNYWEDSRRQCGLCMRAVCSWHSVPGWALCWDCDSEGSKRRAVHPAIMPRRPQPSKCDYNCTGKPYGCCYRCNRWICDACRIEQDVACCVLCPAVTAPKGGLVGMSLKLTLTPRRSAPSTEWPNAQPPREHAPPSQGRTHRMGGWHEATRRKTGLTHTVGQEWKRRRPESK